MSCEKRAIIISRTQLARWFNLRPLWVDSGVKWGGGGDATRPRWFINCGPSFRRGDFFRLIEECCAGRGDCVPPAWLNDSGKKNMRVCVRTCGWRSPATNFFITAHYPDKILGLNWFFSQKKIFNRLVFRTHLLLN